MTEHNRLLRRKEVEALTALSRSSLYRKMREGTFPEPIRGRIARGSMARAGAR